MHNSHTMCLSLLLFALGLAACGRDSGSAQLKTGLQQLNIQLTAVQLDAQSLLDKETPDLVALQQDVDKLGDTLDNLPGVATAETALKPMRQHWHTVQKHLLELSLRNQSYLAYTRQAAGLSKQLAIFTDGLDKLAIASVQLKAPPELIYRATGLLYLNERMQHTLTQLGARVEDSLLLLDRFERDDQLTKLYLHDLHEQLVKLTRHKPRQKHIVTMVETIIREYTQNGPMVNELLEIAPSYLDFIDRTEKFIELLTQMDEMIDTASKQLSEQHATGYTVTYLPDQSQPAIPRS